MEEEEIIEIISILGEDKIDKLYQYIGCKPISVSRLFRFIRDHQICVELKNSKTDFAELAKKYNISLMKIYRLFHAVKGFHKTEKNVKESDATLHHKDNGTIDNKNKI